MTKVADAGDPFVVPVVVDQGNASLLGRGRKHQICRGHPAMIASPG